MDLLFLFYQQPMWDYSPWLLIFTLYLNEKAINDFTS